MILSHPAMATRRAADNLQDMYTTSAPRIRDEQAAYGPHEVDGDEFPAARVLEDLAGSSDEDVPRILARYAALRSWLLGDNDADPLLVRHARETARAYLGALNDWPDAGPLAQLADADPDLAAVSEAAALADLAGHTEGGHALLRAGYLAARRRGDLPRAEHMATEVARRLDRDGADGADLWARRSQRLRKRIDGP